MDATRKCREEMAELILEQPRLLPTLLEIALQEDTPLGSRACWILEFVFKAAPELLYPYLDLFTSGLKGVTPESSIRPLAKICESLLSLYYKPSGGLPRPPLTVSQREAMTEACFDWLISSAKVAPKAYSMQSLLLLGREFNWVHPELKAVLQLNYPSGSPAYQARARHVLGKLS